MMTFFAVVVRSHVDFQPYKQLLPATGGIQSVCTTAAYDRRSLRPTTTNASSGYWYLPPATGHESVWSSAAAATAAERQFPASSADRILAAPSHGCKSFPSEHVDAKHDWYALICGFESWDTSSANWHSYESFSRTAASGEQPVPCPGSSAECLWAEPFPWAFTGHKPIPVTRPAATATAFEFVWRSANFVTVKCWHELLRDWCSVNITFVRFGLHCTCSAVSQLGYTFRDRSLTPTTSVSSIAS